MFKVGITGGIGSGKTFIADVFSLMGVPVYNSDVRAKEIMHSSDDVKLKIKSTFGSQSYHPDGQLNRPYLAEKVFSDPALLSKLNAIVHPAVAQDFDKWCDEQGDTPYVLKEAALIFESGIYTSLDKVILVQADEALRINRVMNRDNVDAKAVQSRIANQWSDKQKVTLSDYIIVNDGERPLLRQVQEIHNLLIHYSENQSK